MIPLPFILSRLSSHEDLFAKLNYEVLNRFFDIMFRYMPRIVTTAPRRRKGLPDLDRNILDVLALNLALTYDEVHILWTATGELLWKQFETNADADEKVTVEAGLANTAPHFGLGACYFYSSVTLTNWSQAWRL